MNNSQSKLRSFFRWFLSFPVNLSGKLILGNMMITLLAILGMGFYVYFRAQESSQYLSNQLQLTVKQNADRLLTSIINEQSTKLNFFFESKSNEISLIGSNINSLLSRESLLGDGTYWDASLSLARQANGSWDNSDSELSSIFIPDKVRNLTPQMILQLNTIKLTETSIPSILEASPEITAIYFGGVTGETIYYPNINLADIVPSDFDVTQRPWFLAANPDNNAGRNIIWSDPYQDAAMNGLIVTSSVPIYKAGGQFRGVAAMDIQLNSITDVVANIHIAESGYALLIDRKNRLIASPAAAYTDLGVTPETLPLGDTILPEKIPGIPNSFFEILSKTSAGESGFSTIEIQGINRYIIYRPLPEIGYSLVVLVPEFELQADIITANQQIQQQTRNTIFLSILLVIAILFSASLASLGISKALTAPLTSLTTTAKEITNGNLDANVEIYNQDEIGVLGQALSAMIKQLKKSFETLEQGVAERTKELEASRALSEHRASELQAISQISKVIAGEQKLTVLLPLITRLISERFGIYHTAIYFLDNTNRYAVLQAASSEGGRTMLARGYKLEIGETGIVGYVGKFGIPRIVFDGELGAVFIENADLPETRSEMALPLIIRNKTVGVLDLQSTKQGTFTDIELNTMSILADQVAIAIDNAQLLQQAQQALSEAEALYRQNTRKSWEEFTHQETIFGYHQTLSGGSKISSPMDTEQVKSVMIHEGGADLDPFLVIPIKLRGEVIGTLKVNAPEEKRKWSKDETNLAEIISERLSLAIENARLIQESQYQAMREQTISNIAAKISTSVRTESILRTTAAELSQLLGDADVFINLQANHSNGRESS